MTKEQLDAFIEREQKQSGDALYPAIHPAWEGGERQAFDIAFERCSQLLAPLLLQAVKLIYEIYGDDECGLTQGRIAEFSQIEAALKETK